LEVPWGPRTMPTGFSVQVSWPALTEEGRVTVPLKPLIGVIMRVDVALVPASVVTLAGLAVTVTSWTWYVTEAECDMPSFVPVTVAL